MKIFLSSTYVDLIEHRKAVVQALRTMDEEVGHMEIFAARDEEATTVSLEELDKCDVLVGVYAYRYGTVPAGSKVSVTEQEYLQAMSKKIPVLVFVVDESHPWPPKSMDKSLVKIKKFKSKATKEHTPDYFTSPDNLAQKVVSSIGRLAIKLSPKPIPDSQASIYQTPKPTGSTLPNLPFFVGREKELEIIKSAISPDSRTWGALIDGPGGIGKTALAIKAAHDAPAELFERKIFITAKVRELTPDGEAKLSDFTRPTYLAMLDELGKELGVDELEKLAPDERPSELRLALAGKKALIIFDNLETLPEEERTRLFQFLSRLPTGNKAIVTSRRRTDVDARIVRLDRPARDEALQLIAELATKYPRLARTAQKEREDLYEITQGNPLFIRWIAGQLGREGSQCRTIAEACAFIDKAPKGNDPLEYIFGDLLETFTATETNILAALTYFSLPAKFKWIAEMTDLAASTVETMLDELTDRSILNSDLSAQTYFLPPLTAKFIRTNRPEAVSQTGDALTNRVTALAMQYGGDDNYEGFHALDAEWDFISAALPRLLTGDNDRLQSVCSQLFPFFNFTEKSDDALWLFQQAEARALASDDKENAGWRAYNAGCNYNLRNQPAEVLACAARAAEHWQDSVPRLKAIAIGLRGLGYKLQEDYPTAITAFRESLEIYRTISAESDDVSRALSSLGEAEQLNKDYDSAEQNYREALHIAKKIKDEKSIAIYTDNLTRLAIDREQWAEAIQTSKKLEPDVSVDELESNMRNLIKEHSYQEARNIFEKIDQIGPSQLPLLKDELGFLFDLNRPAQADLEKIKRDSKRTQWRQQIWQVLSQRNDFVLKSANVQEIVTTTDVKITTDVPKNETVSASFVKAKTTTQQKGEKLELATIQLFQQFFTMGNDNQQVILNALRKQRAGTQYGHDISFEFEDTVQSNPNVKCHVECKNYSNEITLKDVADKLLSERAQPTGIHHWILISPHANPSNELEQLLAVWKETADFPFEIQIWCPETNVQEYFGLDPKVFSRFYRSKKGSVSPRTWTEAQRQEIYKRWQNKLNPPLRLPAGWSIYLRNPEYLLLSNETPKAYDRLYANYVPLRCKDADGNLISEPLEEHVMSWLNGTSKPSLFLLGDFGDGKTAFTYVFARKLAEQFIKNPFQGWIPVRFALREYYKAGNSQEFLKQRLERFGADLKGWTNLKTRHRVLVILDGFDEMTIKLDAQSITRNIKSLQECCEEFDGMKVLITSRTHFFKNLHDVERLRERIHNPEMVYLAPITRYAVMRHLEDRTINEEQKETLRMMCKLHDPIGLASKPLFLQMVEETIYGTHDHKTLPSDLNELILYESYVDQTLHRKMQLLEDEHANVLPSKIINNLRRLLEEIAYGVHISEGKYVLLSEFQDTYGPLAEKLWKISEAVEENVPVTEDATTEIQDVTARLEIRSLLTKVKTDQEDEKWPVDFCHRSLREYFIAKRICRYLEEDLNEAQSVLANTQFGHEIIDFAAEFMRMNQSTDWEKCLMTIVHSTKAKTQGNYLGANCVTLLFRMKGQLPGEDWSGLILDQANLADADLSGKNFANTSLQNANLDNANFENSDFRNSDLTGVRFEETARVQALAVHPSGNSLLVAYEDGSIREWELTHSRKNASHLIFNENSGNLRRIGFSSTEDLWSLTDDYIVFYDRKGMNALSARARFLIKPECHVIIPKKQILLVMSETGNLRSQTRLVDLGHQEILYSTDHADTSLCDHIGHNILVLVQPNAVRLEQFGVAAISKGVEIPTDEISSICFQDIETDQKILLACGYKNGLVRIWKLITNGSNWKYEEIASCSAHEGTVTSITFLDGNRIVSGGTDRKIRIINFGGGQGSPQGIIERTLQLSIRCRGMKIDGIKGTQAKRKLTELIAQAQSQDS